MASHVTHHFDLQPCISTFSALSVTSLHTLCNIALLYLSMSPHHYSVWSIAHGSIFYPPTPHLTSLPQAYPTRGYSLSCMMHEQYTSITSCGQPYLDHFEPATNHAYLPSSSLVLWCWDGLLLPASECSEHIILTVSNHCETQPQSYHHYRRTRPRHKSHFYLVGIIDLFPISLSTISDNTPDLYVHHLYTSIILRVFLHHGLFSHTLPLFSLAFSNSFLVAFRHVCHFPA